MSKTDTVCHKRSSVITDGIPKQPTTDQIDYGEIAINYAANGETLYIKNSENAIAKFKDDKYYQKQLSEKVDKILPLTYSELVSLRDNSQLTPGQQYRITDYVTTTLQENTRSAGNVFDIIVRADSENKLNEESSAIQHEGDEYFANSNLSAWKLWYCLDNDTTRFAWADSTNGKGVIYRMIDEWNNDIPYDFKNIQFKHPLKDSTYKYYYYTFHSSFEESNTDYSLSISNKCHSNTIKEYVDSGKRRLNNIIFNGIYCYGNSFGSNCYNNCFENYSYCNSFGNSFQENTFGNDFRYNTFGNYCYNNTFGSNCYSNTFGNICNYNTFGNDCYCNTSGNDCSRNIFGNYFQANTFGNNCYGNTFGNYIQESQFGDGVQYFSITTQQMATNPTTSSYLKNYIRWLIVENGVRYVNAYVTGSTSISSQCQNVRICLGIQGVNSDNRKTFDITSCIGSTVSNVYQSENSQTTSV